MSKFRKRTSERSRTFLALYYWGKFVGINPLRLSTNNELTFSLFSSFYACFLCFIYCCLQYLVFKERTNPLLPDEKPIAVIVDCTQLINIGLENFFTLLFNGFFQNRLKLIVESFLETEETSRKLNIPEDYEKHFQNLGYYLLLVNGGWLLSIIVHDFGLSGFSAFNPVLWICYSLLRIPSFNSVTTFLWSIIVIKHKFYRVNEKVRFLMVHDLKKCHVIGDNVCSELISNSSHIRGTLLGTIEMISQQRRELIEVINVIKRHFDLLVLLGIMAHISTGMLNVYFMFMSLKENLSMTIGDWLYTFSFISWLFFPLFILLAISNVCGSAVNEANKTGNILHGVLISCENFGGTREVAKLKMFSFEMLQNPLAMSLFGLVNLNNWMIYKVITTATTYFVIMLQFADQ